MRKSIALLTCAAAVCTLVATGCTNSKDPQPTSPVASEGPVTPAPLPTIPLSPQDAHEKAAISDYEAFIGAFNSYFTTGDSQAWDEMTIRVQLPGGEANITPTGQGYGEFLRQTHQAGKLVARQDGEIKVRSPKVIQYTPDPYGNMMDIIVMEVCYDASGVSYVKDDGSELAHGRAAFVATVTLKNTPQPIKDGADWSKPDDWTDLWRITDQANDWERPCA